MSHLADIIHPAPRSPPKRLTLPKSHLILEEVRGVEDLKLGFEALYTRDEVL